MKSSEEIAKTLPADGMRLDREMLPYCSGVYRVQQRIEWFIDERDPLKDPPIAGAQNIRRRLCLRAIYSYRLERAA